jgi:hypothetical protein
MVCALRMFSNNRALSAGDGVLVRFVQHTPIDKLRLSIIEFRLADDRSAQGAQNIDVCDILTTQPSNFKVR